MYNQQFQGNPVLQAREYSQPGGAAGEASLGGDKKSGRFAEYQVMQQVSQQPAMYSTMQEPLNNSHVNQYYQTVYPYQFVYENQNIYSKQQVANGSQVNQEKAGNAKINLVNGAQYSNMKMVQAQDMNLGHVSYYPAYATTQQQIQAYPQIVSSVQYPNSDYFLRQQALQYQFPTTAVKREYPSTPSTTVEKNAKKPQVNVKQPTNRVTTNPGYSQYNYPIVSNQNVFQVSDVNTIPQQVGRAPQENPTSSKLI